MRTRAENGAKILSYDYYYLCTITTPPPRRFVCRPHNCRVSTRTIGTRACQNGAGPNFVRGGSLGLLTTSKLTSSSTRVHIGTPLFPRDAILFLSTPPCPIFQGALPFPRHLPRRLRPSGFRLIPAPAFLHLASDGLALANLPPGAHPRITSLANAPARSHNCRPRDRASFKIRLQLQVLSAEQTTTTMIRAWPDYELYSRV